MWSKHQNNQHFLSVWDYCGPLWSCVDRVTLQNTKAYSVQVLWFGQICTGMSSHWPWRGASLSCETMAFRCLLLPSHLSSNLSLWLSHFCHPLNTIGKDSSSLMLLTVASFTVWFSSTILLFFGWLSGPLFGGLPLLKKVLCTPILW